jgi:hypothetical protein
MDDDDDERRLKDQLENDQAWSLAIEALNPKKDSDVRPLIRLLVSDKPVPQTARDFLANVLQQDKWRWVRGWGLVVKKFPKTGRRPKRSYKRPLSAEEETLYQEMKAERAKGTKANDVYRAFADRGLGRRSTLIKLWNLGQLLESKKR